MRIPVQPDDLRLEYIVKSVDPPGNGITDLISVKLGEFSCYIHSVGGQLHRLIAGIQDLNTAFGIIHIGIGYDGSFIWIVHFDIQGHAGMIRIVFKQIHQFLNCDGRREVHPILIVVDVIQFQLQIVMNGIPHSETGDHQDHTAGDSNQRCDSTCFVS